MANVVRTAIALTSWPLPPCQRCKSRQHAWVRFDARRPFQRERGLMLPTQLISHPAWKHRQPRVDDAAPSLSLGPTRIPDRLSSARARRPNDVTVSEGTAEDGVRAINDFPHCTPILIDELGAGHSDPALPDALNAGRHSAPLAPLRQGVSAISCLGMDGPLRTPTPSKTPAPPR
jgi:hypothetical protein